MRAVSNILACALCVILIAGLWYSQVCDASCAFYGCHNEARTEKAARLQQSSHCHESDSAPVKQNDFPNCEYHADALALLPSITSPIVPRHKHAQPHRAGLAVSLDASFENITLKSVEGTLFRSPLKASTPLVLRI